MRDHRPRSAIVFFEKDQIFHLHQHTMMIAKINESITAFLPENARRQCRVANFRQGILIIECSNAAWLTRLNYERARMLSYLRANQLSNLTTIEFKINPSIDVVLSQNRSIQKQNKKQCISEQSASYLRAIASYASEDLKRRLEAIANLSIKEK